MGNDLKEFAVKRKSSFKAKYDKLLTQYEQELEKEIAKLVKGEKDGKSTDSG